MPIVPCKSGESPEEMLRRTLCFLILAFTLSSCESEDPTPHLKDPIYKDLKSQADFYQKAVEEGKKKLSELKEKLEKTEANSIDQKDVRRDIASTEAKLLDASQKALFYKIRSDRRVVTAKVDAHKAFEEKKEWPDKAEYSDYLTNKRLRESSLNWNKRVPKLQDRLSKKVTKKTEGEEAPAAASHE